jgi:fluoroquinolone transport system permease protein
MKRLLTAIRGDMRLQFRNGFYYAAAFVMVVMVILLRQFTDEIVTWMLPIFIVGNLLINTFYFVSGLVLLEKEEGTLTAQIVTPLRRSEYLAAKVITLTLLSLFENGLIVLLVGSYLRPGFFLLAVLGASAMLTLTGFVVVIRYDSINQFLMPSVLYTSLLMLPLMTYLGLPEHWLLYLHPLQAPWLLMQAAFNPAPLADILYGLLAACVWSFFLFRLAQNAFYHFIVARQ